MAKKEQVSICINDLFEASKAGHPAIVTAKNGKKYAYVDIWENDEPDKYGNDFSVSLYDKEAKKATYIGNGKKYKPQASAPEPQHQAAPVQFDEQSDLPF